MKVSRKIKMIMKAKKMHSQELADKIGISKQTVYNTFGNDSHSERSGMTFETVARYADALGCDVIIRDRETGEEY